MCTVFVLGWMGYSLVTHSQGGGGVLCISSDREDQIGAQSKPKQIALLDRASNKP